MRRRLRSPRAFVSDEDGRVDRNRAGDRCARVSRSRNSEAGIHLRWSITSRWISGIIGVAASKVKSPILKNDQNISQSCFIVPVFEDGCLSSVPISGSLAAATNAVAMTAAVSVRRRCEPSVISRKPPRTARSISSGEKSPSGPIRTSTSPPLCRMWGRNALPRAERGASQWAMNFCPSKGCLMTCRSGLFRAGGGGRL